MKRVLVDARMVGPVGHGIARYVQLMAKGIRELYGSRPMPYELIFLVRREGQEIERFRTVPCKARFLTLREIFAIPWIARRLRIRLFHSPSFVAIPRMPCPWISTPHDLIHLKFGDAKRRLYYRALLRPFVRGARRATTVSEYSRAQIAHWAHMPWERIEVVYNAIEAPEPVPDLEAVLGRFGLRKGGYFLSLSNTKPHKNLATLVHAYAQYRREVKGARQREPWPLVLTATLEATPEGVQALGGVGELEARALVAGAGALAFPSIDEGFGRPPLEAAVCGVPILVSRIAPHQEALMDFQGTSEVEWVSPLDVPAWSHALRKAFDGRVPPASAETRARILERYSVRRLGERMDRIYRDVLGISS